MISFFVFVCTFTATVVCQSFHSNQHLPVQKFPTPLRYQPYQQPYIPYYRPPPTKAGETSAPLTQAEIEEIQRQYQQWQIAIPNGGTGSQPGGVVWISAPQYSYYPPPPNYPPYSPNNPVPYPPPPPSPGAVSPGPAAYPSQPTSPQESNPAVTQSRGTSGTTPANSTSEGTTVTDTPVFTSSSSTYPPTNESSSEVSSTLYPSSEASSTLYPTSEASSTNYPTSESPSTYPPENQSTSESSSTYSPGSSTTYSPSSSSYPPSTDQPQNITNATSTEQPQNVTNTSGPESQNGTNNATSDNPLLKYCKKSRGQFESKECNKFVNCWDDVAVEQACPSGLLFNSEKQYCDYPNNVNCGNRTSSTGPEGPGSSGNATANEKCPNGYGTYRNSSNCAAFYVCVAGEAVNFACPPGTNYNDELKVCDYPYRVNCKGAPSIPIPEESSTTQVNETAPESSNSTSFSNSTSSSSSSSSASSSANGTNTTSSSSSSSNSSSSANSNESQSQISTVPPPLPISSTTYSPTSSSTTLSTTTYEPTTASISSSEPPSSTLPPPAPVTTDAESATFAPPGVDPVAYYNFNLKKLPESIVNTGVRCYHSNVFRLTPDCSSVTVCQDGTTYIVNCGSTTSFDAYTQQCVPTFRARC